HDLSLVVTHRVVARQKPAIAPVGGAQPDLQLVRRAGDNSPFSHSVDPFGIVGMGFRSGLPHDALPTLIERGAEVRERRAIDVETLALGSEYGDELRCEVEYLPQFHLALAQGRRQLLLFRDVDSRSDEPLPVCRRDADATNVTNRSIGPNNPLGEVEAVMVREHLLNFVRNELPILRVHERHVLRYARSLGSRIETVDREQFG